MEQKHPHPLSGAMKAKIEAAARKIAGEVGLINVTMLELCRRADIPTGSFQKAMGGMSFSYFIESLEPEFPETPLTVTRSKVPALLRKKQILATALYLSQEDHYQKVTCVDIANAAGVSRQLVTVHFPTMEILRREIMAAAVDKGVLRVIAQGLERMDAMALAVPSEVQRKAIQTLIA